MTEFVKQPNVSGLVKVSGKISNYHSRRESASFVFTSGDQTNMGVVAIAAAVAGLSGQAIATASNASSMEEQADYLQFFLNGRPVRGWVWRSPLKDGDEVEVAAEWQGDHYEVFGIARPSDRTIALYPHCSRGSTAHSVNAFKWWFWLGCITIFLFITAVGLSIDGISVFNEIGLYITSVIMSAFFGLMTISLAKKWMPFVLLAEKVFRVLEWNKPSNIDLVKSSKAQRTPKDPGEFGTFYFRY
jgi:hypothetical protein